jgi:UDP-glucose 4-epimerase
LITGGTGLSDDRIEIRDRDHLYEEAYEPGFEDMQRRIPDTSTIRSLLGWHPTKSLAEILSEVIDEHRGGARTPRG